jgi:hypothetical protein
MARDFSAQYNFVKAVQLSLLSKVAIAGDSTSIVNGPSSKVMLYTSIGVPSRVYVVHIQPGNAPGTLRASYTPNGISFGTA